MTAYRRPTSRLGQDLLPKDLGEDREQALALLNASYASVLDSRQENFGLWQAVRQGILQPIKTRYRANGLVAPRFNYDAFWARADLPMPSRDPMAHAALVQALLTDYQEAFQEHLIYRLENDGNVHLDFQGPTGMAKSSCAIAVADWLQPIEPSRLVEHLSFDVSELPAKLKDKPPGATVIQDEYVASAGEGARTYRSLFDNLEDTLRASQVNLFRCSPRQQDEGTMQATLELVMWNKARKYSLFLVWLEGTPHGVIALPWCREELYATYKPWKAGNVKRSLAGHFRDNSYLAKSVLIAFGDQRLVDFLRDAANKPKLADFRAALEFFHPQMHSNSQVDKLVGFMHNICYNWERIGPKFEAWFGVKPNRGLEEVAAKCYQQ